MAIKKTEVEMDGERKIITHMIVSTEFLEGLRGVVDAHLFSGGYTRLVATWILEFFRISGVAPGKAIMDVYQRNIGDISDDDKEMVSKFLTSISEDWKKAEPNNVKYELECAVKYLKLRSIERLIETLRGSVTDGNPANGEKAIGDFRRVERISGSGINMFAPDNALRISKILNLKEKEIFRFHGAFGEVVGPLNECEFAAFLAPPKRGKTWALLHTAQRAYLSDLNVLFVSLEMKEQEVTERLWRMMEGRPKDERDLVLPRFADFGPDQSDGCRIEFVTERRVGLDSSVFAIEKRQKFYNTRFNGQLKVECFNPSQFSPKDLRTTIKNYQLHENWIPQVVCVDYADIMRSDGGEKDERARLNSIWLGLNSLRLEMNLCMFSASQSGRDGVKGKEVQAGDISEDIRKLAHVTRLITLNQSDEEKARGIIRANQKVSRSTEINHAQVCILQNLNIGRFYLDSRYCSCVQNLMDFRGKIE